MRAALRLIHSEGPWHVSAKREKGFTGKVFAPGSEGGAAGWAIAQNRTLNTYVSIAALRAGWQGDKAKKEDVASVGWLWVDLDPRAGEELDLERARLLGLLTTDLPKGVPPPTVIIDSGRGFWGLWRLSQPVVMPPADDPAWDAARASVEDRNRGLELAFGADACHNLERVCRLPGTVNRKPGGRLARVVRADASAHDLLAFPPVSDPKAGGAVKVAGGGAPVAGRVALAGPVGRLNSLDDLRGVSDHTKKLIVQGLDPDNPGKWEADRSNLVLHVLCDLIRADVSDDDMLAVILDRDFGVSAHVLEQPKPESYARRQVQRALERQPRPGPVVTGAPMHWARALRDARRPRLLHHHEEFLDWDGAAYIGLTEATIRAEAWAFLETCRMERDKEVRPFVPTPGAVSAALDALKAVSHLPPSRVEPPRWLDGRARPDPLDLLPTRSGLLHLPSGDLLPATPELFTRNALDFAHDPAAPAPVRWLAFLKEVWPGADEADCIAALQEFMGYLLTPDTSLQKALLIPGPKRSGKGTIGRIMGKLVGEANTVAPSLNSLGRSDFGLEPLLAKQLAIVSDMRLSSRTDEAAVAENLLRITGEDRVSVNRKHRSAMEVTLRARFVVMTNEVPKFADRSGALVSRFIVLPMRQSFFGREDSGLTPALIGELPGILNWAMEGWRRVRANGRITQPEGGRDVALQMTDLASPIPAFVREWCEVGGGHRVAKDHLFTAFRAWHRERIGHDFVGSSNTFARDLYSAMEGGVRDVKPRDGGGTRVPSFGGIRLRPDVGFRPTDAEPPF
ncbi:DNA primase family protein [Loktanella fryxellensis]|uniref:DNA primase family protein n=1 Tax=Loktanella fryxellensis TaxID=245187 RepID=UPI00115FF41A|nr:phage/plasmid primase, P4 family [Loktanella fryxellensis]